VYIAYFACGTGACADVGALRLAYYVSNGGNCGPANAWQCDTIDNGSGNEVVGQHPSLRLIGAGNTPYVTYLDVTNNRLKLAYEVGSGGNCGPGGNTWHCEVIGSAEVGETNLAVDSAGTLHVAYWSFGARTFNTPSSAGSSAAAATITSPRVPCCSIKFAVSPVWSRITDIVVDLARAHTCTTSTAGASRFHLRHRRIAWAFIRGWSQRSRQAAPVAHRLTSCITSRCCATSPRCTRSAAGADASSSRTRRRRIEGPAGARGTAAPT
jgi:hypothetical protein